MKSKKLEALGAALALAAAAAPALADSPSQRWESWRQIQLSGPPDRALPRLAWAYFGDAGIPADDAGFGTYAQAGFTLVQTKLNPGQMSTAEKEGLKLFIGTWENALGNDDKLHQIAAAASQDPNVSVIMLKDEAEAPALGSIGQDYEILYRETPPRVLPFQTILPAHASKPGNHDRFDPTRACRDSGSYCDFVHRVIGAAHPAAVAITLYPLLSGGDRPGYYHELEQLRKQTEEAHIGLLGFVLITPHFDGWSNQRYKRPQLSDVMWQVNSLLANNAKGISYYNYRIKQSDREQQHGAFDEGMVAASDGRPTDTYGEVQRVNCMLAGVGKTLMGLDVRDTFLPDESRGKATAATQAGEVTVTGDDLLVSTMEPHGGGGGSSWVMIVNSRHGAGAGPVRAHLQTAGGTHATLASSDDSCHLRRSPLVEHNGVDIEIGPGESRLVEVSR
jgi:hypothetical protein